MLTGPAKIKSAIVAASRETRELDKPLPVYCFVVRGCVSFVAALPDPGPLPGSSCCFNWRGFYGTLLLFGPPASMSLNPASEDN